MGTEDKNEADREEERFLELYRQEMALPSYLRDSYEIASCLSWKEEEQVYLLRDRRNRSWILKRASGRARDILKKEAENLKSLSFSFLPQCVFWREEEGVGWLLREYIPGDTLWEIVEREGPMSVERAGELLGRLCEMIAQLHECDPPVIHRDLKPQNIVLTPEENLYLIDVETVREFKEDSGYDTVFVGTRPTAAPEQYGYRQTDCRTDVYALGVVYRYLLTGSFVKPDPGTMEELSPACLQVVEKCTQMDPVNRYQNCRELKSAILRIPADGQAVEPERKGKHRKGAVLAGLLMLLIVLGIGIYFGWRQSPYTFHSEMIEQAVREQLGKTSGELIRRKDLAQIKELRICGSHILLKEDEHTQNGRSHSINGQVIDPDSGTIRDLTDVSRMSSLETLVLDRQLFTDLAPLEDLPLKRLSLGDTPVEEFSALTSLKELEELYVAGTKFSDLALLQDLPELKVLDISGTSVEELAPLEGMEVEELIAFDMKPMDTAVLERLSLRKLMIHSFSSEMEETVGRMTSLQELTMYNYGQTTLEPLLGLKNLNSLDLFGGWLKSLDGIEEFKNLRNLVIGGTLVTDLSPLENVTEMSTLCVDNTGVYDFSVIADLPYLRWMKIDQTQEESLYEAVSFPGFALEVTERKVE